MNQLGIFRLTGPPTGLSQPVHFPCISTMTSPIFVLERRTRRSRVRATGSSVCAATRGAGAFTRASEGLAATAAGARTNRVGTAVRRRPAVNIYSRVLAAITLKAGVSKMNWVHSHFVVILKRFPWLLCWPLGHPCGVYKTLLRAILTEGFPGSRGLSLAVITILSWGRWRRIGSFAIRIVVTFFELLNCAIAMRTGTQGSLKYVVRLKWLVTLLSHVVY